MLQKSPSQPPFRRTNSQKKTANFTSYETGFSRIFFALIEVIPSLKIPHFGTYWSHIKAFLNIFNGWYLASSPSFSGSKTRIPTLKTIERQQRLKVPSGAAKKKHCYIQLNYSSWLLYSDYDCCNPHITGKNASPKSSQRTRLFLSCCPTVDGRNPQQPPEIYKTLKIIG